jgi:hypothetical protein
MPAAMAARVQDRMVIIGSPRSEWSGLRGESARGRRPCEDVTKSDVGVLGAARGLE